MEQEEKPVEEVVEEVAEEQGKVEVDEEVSQEETPSEEPEVVEEEKKEERPEKNYKAELARKNAELQKLRAAQAARNAEPSKRDPNDIKTWSDHELKAIISSNDPSVLAYKDAAQEELLDRRVAKVFEKKATEEKRALADIKLREKYPEALDPESELALKMEQVMEEYDLQKSPAGRLAAAKIAASELGKGRSDATAKERNAEKARVARVKGQMIDGDRSKSVQSSDPKKIEQLKQDINSKNANVADIATKEFFKLSGLDRDSFFGKR